MKILVIEDDKTFKMQLLAYFKQERWDVSCVDSVDDVYELANCDVWDVIILSSAIPGVFCFAQRCADSLPQTRVVIMSARYSLKEKLTCYELGVEMYLVKPFTPVDLLNAINLLCKKRNASKLHANLSATLSISSRIMSAEGALVRLSEKECLLLHALVLADQGRLEAWQLMERLNIMDLAKGVKYLGIIVSRLRTKLKEHHLPEDVIKAVRGYGYQLTVPIQLV